MTYVQLNRREHGGPNRQLGLTLVELMIAMLLGLILTAGTIQIFIANRTTYAFNESLSWIQENARFALDHMSHNARMAGYVGCLSDVSLFNNLDGPANGFRDDLTGGIQGYEFGGTGVGDAFAAGAAEPAPLADAAAWDPALPPELSDPARVIPGSDVLVARYVSGDSHPLVSPFSDSSQLFVEPPHEFVEGQVLVVTDCQKASIFQLTEVQTTGFGINLVHSGNNTYTPGNTSPTWGPEQSYGLGSEVALMQTIVFYVGRGANGAPSLFQLRLQRIDPSTSTFQPEELVEGIETMQVRYGVDTDDDSRINVWQTADAVDAGGDWTNVVSVQISLLARADEEYGTETDTAVYGAADMQFDPVDDRRLRKVFTTTVGVRNRLP